MHTTISSKGQITVPAAVREALGLVPGTKLELELGPRGTFIARKAVGSGFFARFQGLAAGARVIGLATEAEVREDLGLPADLAWLRDRRRSLIGSLTAALARP